VIGCKIKIVKLFQKESKMILLLLVTLLALPSQIHAYIDPGTGSYLFQLFIAGALGSLYAVKTYWTALKHYFFSKIKK
jgi:uncharacterized membrane protein HdeD (DUF308 family)